MKPKILLIIGPTAVGKSSLIDRALKEYPQLVDIITYTTRPMRAGESEGRPYHFVTADRFKQLVDERFFVEWAHVHGRMYGTPRDQIEAAATNGRAIILDIDVQGAKTLMREYPQTRTVFIKPPSMDTLRHRFEKRGVSDPEDLEKRLKSAETEMSQAGDFQFVIVNDDFEAANAEFRKIIENLLKNQ